MRTSTSDSRGVRWILSAVLLTAGTMVQDNQSVLAAEQSEGTLQHQLAERDAAIEALSKRVRELERRSGRTDAGAPPQQSAHSSRQAVPASTPKKEQAPATAPGTVNVDALAAERALERTLTAEGALLLPANTFELEPFFDYTRREANAPTLVVVDDSVVARTLDAKRNEFDFGVRGRYGLPWDAQLELEVPYRIVEQSVVLPVGMSDFDKSSETATSFGDVKVGIAKTLVRERGWLPDLVGRLTWDTGTGDLFDNGVSLGGIGFDEIRASLSALKRQDPLAFTATVSYQTAFERDNIEPGDQFGISLGASLAASPETALSVVLAQNFSQEVKVNGHNVSGSNQVSSVLFLGASSVLARRTLLLFNVGIGLTDDAPDYSVNLSLPIRF